MLEVRVERHVETSALRQRTAANLPSPMAASAGLLTVPITGNRSTLRLAMEEVVYQASERRNQENLIEQLKNGVNAMRVPLYDLVSNWAYMVIASLAWTLKAWTARCPASCAASRVVHGTTRQWHCGRKRASQGGLAAERRDRVIWPLVIEPTDSRSARLLPFRWPDGPITR